MRLQLVVKILILVLLAVPGYALDRCEALVQNVRVQHFKYFGLAFPYWYSVSQLNTESACRTTITAGDGGRGVAQFMPKTSQYIQSLMGEKLDPYNSRDAIKMQAFYMYRIHTKENWTDKLFIDFQTYNGGRSLLYKEYQRAGIVDWDLMRLECKRNKVQFKWGVLDFCEVNYSYSQKIYKGGQKYRRGVDGYKYW